MKAAAALAFRDLVVPTAALIALAALCRLVLGEWPHGAALVVFAIGAAFACGIGEAAFDARKKKSGESA